MPPAHISLYISVPDTPTAFNYCSCSFNWKFSINGNFELSFATSALNTEEIEGSSSGRLSPVKPEYIY
jgi:hypothetical protein